MGKKKKDKAPKLSKKELRKIAEKAEKKAAKKAAAKAEKKAQAKADAAREKMAKATKKGKTKGADRPTESATSSESGVAEATEQTQEERHPHLQHLDRVGELTAILNDEAAKPKAKKVAQAELDQLREQGEALQSEKDQRRAELSGTAEEIDAAIAARLEKKGARRKERIAAGESSILPEEPGSPERLAVVQQDTAERQGAKGPKDIDPKKHAKRVKDLAEAEAEAAIESDGGSDDDAQSDRVREAVEEEVFAKPSEAPKTDFDVNGNNQYKIKHPTEDKTVSYTRVTTYIACLEDTTALTAWKMRILLEGVAAVEDLADRDGGVTAKVRDLVHQRDVAITKARKQDRKGKLQLGELATYVEGAWRDFKRALDALADEVFEVGGGRAAATHGTDIHALCDLHDAEGMNAVQDKLDAGEITPADFADVEAYARAIKDLGLKIVASEQTVVNDDLKVAGRLDRIVLGKLAEIRDPKTGDVIRPADARARRYVLDIKTGRIDYGAGKIAQQIRLYAESQSYDVNTDERSSHGANRTTGLVLHLPPGSAKATVHIVDLAVGGVGNKLAGEVRAFRNTGKKAINHAIDLLALDQPEAEETTEEEAA
ncbi:hypothetical protein SEA_FUZZBUSTER_62 [Microbacterium phage FuzzBuster]|uniref:Uncharacterized protein n=1 Tax=Microbacterium phage FuzzBuster TaxID=2590935 RepID=A0A516KV36_9CAUD|nr:hypothetical protein SEA_FUZZBUSTER_62 [Microbacterium phage FuzzBuster]